MKRISGGQLSREAKATHLSSHAEGPRTAAGDTSLTGQAKAVDTAVESQPAASPRTYRSGRTSPPRQPVTLTVTAVRCPTEAVARPVTSASRGPARGSPGRRSRPPRAARRVVLVHLRSQIPDPARSRSPRRSSYRDLPLARRRANARQAARPCFCLTRHSGRQPWRLLDTAGWSSPIVRRKVA